MGRFATLFNGYHWFVNFLFGILATMAALALTIWLLTIFGSRLTPVPLVITSIEARPPQVCPGDALTLVMTVSNRDRDLIEVYGVVMDGEQQAAITTAPSMYYVVPRSAPGDFAQPFVWPVPKLAPGLYYFSLTLSMRDSGADAVFGGAPVHVLDDCNNAE